MRYLYSLFIVIILLIIVPNNLKATHIVGGEITYECLGNSRYAFHMTVFRDCDTGVPWFDNPAKIGIFRGGTGTLYTTRNLPFITDDTLNLSLNDSCISFPPNVCIHATIYSDTVTLPYRADGYVIAYQRCCRNQDIVNIIDATTTGATFLVHITGAALAECNSSPVFRDWPPVYICRDIPIDFDHSAIDSDGDSIVYELCTPLEGATDQDPIPDPIAHTPYFQVLWKLPYSEQNMMGGSDPLRIDPQTGQLTGTPTNLGVFVVGICAKEYRNGVLLSITRRDFQYAVGVCGRQVSSAFYSPTVPCSEVPIVAFNNNSQAILGSYLWDFGDPNSAQNSSQFKNPTHTFSDTGTYTVTLIADPGTYCADTSEQLINVQLTGVNLEVSSYTDYCAYDTVKLYVTNKTGASLSSSTIVWSPDLEILAGQGTDTILVVADTNKTFNVVLENEFGCSDSTLSTINIINRYALAQFQSSNSICNTTLDIQFNNKSASSADDYLWDFGDPNSAQNSSTAQNPIHSYSDTGTYTVTLIVDPGKFCADTILKTLDIKLEGVDISVNTATGYCPGDSVQLFLTDEFPLYTDSLVFEWFPDVELLSGQGTDSVWVVADRDKDIQVRAVNHFGCADTAVSAIVTTGLFPPLDIQANTDSIFKGQTAQLVATQDIDYNYTWEAHPSLSSMTIYNPIIAPTVTTSYTLTVTNAQGCVNVDSIVMNIKPPVCGNPTVFIPNAFTPNNDGDNDVLYVRGANIKEVYLVIYNRWGEKMFETNDLNIGWDGTYKGEVLAPDVFGYHLDCLCNDGYTLFQKGNITLIR